MSGASKRKYKGIPDRYIGSINNFIRTMREDNMNEDTPAAKKSKPSNTFSYSSKAKMMTENTSLAKVLYVDGVNQLIISYNRNIQRWEIIIIDCGMNLNNIRTYLRNQGDLQTVSTTFPESGSSKQSGSSTQSGSSNNEQIESTLLKGSMQEYKTAILQQLIHVMQEDLPENFDIKTVIFSHPHPDHTDHMLELLDGQEVGCFIFHGYPAAYADMDQGNFLRGLKKSVTEHTKVFIACLNKDVSSYFREKGDPVEYFQTLTYYSAQPLTKDHSFLGHMRDVNTHTTLANGKKLMVTNHLTCGESKVTLLSFNASVVLTDEAFRFATTDLDAQCLIAKVSIKGYTMVFPGDANITSQEYAATSTDILSSSRNSEFIHDPNDTEKVGAANSVSTFVSWKPNVVILAMSNNNSLPSLNCVKTVVDTLELFRRKNLEKHSITVFLPKESFEEITLEADKEPPLLSRRLAVPEEYPEQYKDNKDPTYKGTDEIVPDSDRKLRVSNQSPETVKYICLKTEAVATLRDMKLEPTNFDICEEGNMYPVFLDTCWPILTSNALIGIVIENEKCTLLQAPYVDGDYVPTD